MQAWESLISFLENYDSDPVCPRGAVEEIAYLLNQQLMHKEKEDKINELVEIIEDLRANCNSETNHMVEGRAIKLGIQLGGKKDPSLENTPEKKPHEPIKIDETITDMSKFQSLLLDKFVMNPVIKKDPTNEELLKESLEKMQKEAQKEIDSLKVALTEKQDALDEALDHLTTEKNQFTKDIDDCHNRYNIL